MLGRVFKVSYDTLPPSQRVYACPSTAAATALRPQSHALAGCRHSPVSRQLQRRQLAKHDVVGFLGQLVSNELLGAAQQVVAEKNMQLAHRLDTLQQRAPGAEAEATAAGALVMKGGSSQCHARQNRPGGRAASGRVQGAGSRPSGASTFITHPIHRLAMHAHSPRQQRPCPQPPPLRVYLGLLCVCGVGLVALEHRGCKLFLEVAGAGEAARRHEIHDCINTGPGRGGHVWGGGEGRVAVV